uniref:Subunit of meta-cleavage enzyme n=1 Tax=Neptuniibacter sp. CAR-SF TaxID=197651 RepID=B2DD12_9GAMM|nr:subunit of meta-cleavage enzyme [Neptuniibacter sp. CAR-SF]
MARYEVHRLIQSLIKDRGQCERYNINPDAFFKNFDLVPNEEDVLRKGTAEALSSININPILQMHYLLITNPEMSEHVSITGCLKLMKGGS